jgi:hypothetical protein
MDASRTDLEPITNKAGQCPAFVRSAFDLRTAVGLAKPSGLGMVSSSQHAARCATEARYRPGAACFIAGPRRAAVGRKPSPWSCGT